VDVGLDLLIVVEKSFQLIAKLLGIELRDLHRLLVGTMSFLAQSRLVPSHKFRSAKSAEPIELCHRLGQLLTGFLSELLDEPFCEVLFERVRPRGVDVPSHIHEERKRIGRHFGVVDDGDPLLPDVFVPAVAQRLVDQSWLCCGQPKVIVRCALVAEMIQELAVVMFIFPVCSGHTLQIAVAVVGIYQSFLVVDDVDVKGVGHFVVALDMAMRP